MKSTGVVRRIDDLGRIVIPKEIRRTLRIRDGESLEIYIENDTILLKKYSPMDDLYEISNELVIIISQSLNKDIFITDGDKIIAISGSLKSKYLDKNISNFIVEKLNNRENYSVKSISDIEFINNQSEKCSCVINPIIANGDGIGVVVIFSLTGQINDLDLKIVSIISKFLGVYIEE